MTEENSSKNWIAAATF
jgi:hypothetical protein